MSTQGKKHLCAKIFSVLLIFILVAGGVFIGFQYFTKTGLFKIPGVVYFDESISEEEKTTFQAFFPEELILDQDVTISAAEYTKKPALESNQFLYEIYVPVTDFYSVETSITSEEALALRTESSEDYELVKIGDLTSDKKLLSIDDNYYLDEFDSGAIFRVITFASETYAEEIESLVSEGMTKVFPAKSTVLTFAQTGVTALSRDMITKLNNTGGDGAYFAEKIKDYLSSFDLTHTSNESSFVSSDVARGTVSSRSKICSDERMLQTLTSIGLDIVELTGNHNRDCGDEAANWTLELYEENNIQIVGGGATAEEAAEPLLISEKDTNITFIAYNQSTGGATYDATPGANQYYEEDAIENITAAKERGDFVIVDIQYYECNAYASDYEDPTCDYAGSSAGDQIGFFRHFIDLGADMVVGTSAHQPQTYELYSDGVIYYGLGNLFFDQVWWPGTTRSLILSHYFYDGELLQTKIVPTVYDDDMQPTLMDEETTEWFLTRLTSERP